MNTQLSYKNIVSDDPVPTPMELKAEFPATPVAEATVLRSRDTIERILEGADPRKILVVGPCSIHDIDEAKAYAKLLKPLAEQVRDQFFVVMRTCFEKPRSDLGWPGYIGDPKLDGSGDINTGLRNARNLLVYLAELGMPAGAEFLDTYTPAFISDLISYGWIGARTVDAPPQRHLASGLSMPVGFKNGLDGKINSVIRAIRTARHGHTFQGTNQEGKVSVIRTKGNGYVHGILRGGESGPNYSREHLISFAEELNAANLNGSSSSSETTKQHRRLLIDCSHGNSRKDYLKQPGVLLDVIAQLNTREPYTNTIAGLLLESYLDAGKQDLIFGSLPKPRISITDACMSFDMTREAIVRAYETWKMN